MEGKGLVAVEPGDELVDETLEEGGGRRHVLTNVHLHPGQGLRDRSRFPSGAQAFWNLDPSSRGSYFYLMNHKTL